MLTLFGEIMQIETDGKDLILTPENNDECTDLYLSCVERHYYKYRLDIEAKQIKAMRISKETLLKMILQRSI